MCAVDRPCRTQVAADAQLPCPKGPRVCLVQAGINPYCFCVGGVGVKIEFFRGWAIPTGHIGVSSPYEAGDNIVPAAASEQVEVQSSPNAPRWWAFSQMWTRPRGSSSLSQEDGGRASAGRRPGFGRAAPRAAPGALRTQPGQAWGRAALFVLGLNQPDPPPLSRARLASTPSGSGSP